MSLTQHKTKILFGILTLGIAIELLVLAVDFSFITIPSLFSSEESLKIQFIGEEQDWSFSYAGDDHILGTDDDVEIKGGDNLLMPINKALTIELTSKDYLYCLDIPELQKTQIALPGMEFSMQLMLEERDTFFLVPGAICGLVNWELTRKIIAVSDSDFENWLQENKI